MRATRNLSVDIMRIIAAFSIVALHCVPLNEVVGIAIHGIARFAVPLFFAITGFYSEAVSVERARNKLYQTLMIIVVATLIYLIRDIAIQIRQTGDVYSYIQTLLNVKTLSKIVFLGQNPVAGHLWYLNAIAFIYILLILEATINSHKYIRPSFFYNLGAAGLVVLLACDLFAKGAEMHVNNALYRNALFMGLPMFLMGYLIRQNYNDEIERNRHSLEGNEQPIANRRHLLNYLIVAILGMPLTLLQEFGLGTSELPLGSIVTAFGLLSFSTRCKNPRSQPNILRRLPMSDISLTIYVTHLLVIFVLLNNVGAISRYGDRSWILTIAVIVISAVIGIVYGYSKRIFRRLLL